MIVQPSSGEKFLDSIFVYNIGNKQKFEKYLGNLPHGLSLDWNNVELVKKYDYYRVVLIQPRLDNFFRYGEPEGKPKPSVGGIVPIYIDYKRLGMQIDFIHASYEHMNNTIESVCFYPPEK